MSARLLAAALAAYAVAASMALDTAAQAPEPADARPVERAIAYLAAEVPRWRQEHPCYSCHNNGDAARALVTAAGLGYDVGDSIDDTLAWLATPERWDANDGRGGSDDLPLGRIQFASTLAQMVAWDRAGQDALDRAAALLPEHQREDGSFWPNPLQTIGGATAYGQALATMLAHRVLDRATIDAAAAPAARAREWMRTVEAATVLDASSIVIGLERDGDAAATERRQEALQLLKRAQAPDGGWGPYATSPSDVFDTALAVMALVTVRHLEALHAPAYSAAELEEAIRRARAYLVETQTPEGSWPETTRPAGGESYAQRISTTAWALQVLLVSQ